MTETGADENDCQRNLGAQRSVRASVICLLKKLDWEDPGVVDASWSSQDDMGFGI